MAYSCCASASTMRPCTASHPRPIAHFEPLPPLAPLQSEELQRFIAWARKQRVTNADIDNNLRRYRR